MGELIAAGRARAAGKKAFAARDHRKSGVYSFEQREAPAFDQGLAARFRRNRAAWRFFQAQPPGYRRLATWFVVSAKREATRQRRLDLLVAQSAAGRRLEPMKPGKAIDTPSGK
jgi:uncharacterized protein YdeI (YjbR/CyaY-like superfamily)